MSFSEQNPKCSLCKSDEADVWEKTDSDEILCDKCYDLQRTGVDPAQSRSSPPPLPPASDAPGAAIDPQDTRPEDQSTEHPVPSSTDTASGRDSRSKAPSGSGSSQTGGRSASTTAKDLFESKSWTRKSSRIKPLKNKSQTVTKAQATKGRSRRVVFKKKPMKAPSASATVITSNHIFHQGYYWQIGDIVSVCDIDNGSLYYAQLRGFLQDAFNEKSAVITWLIPTSLSPAEGFDASTYILGPEEEVPRKMEYFEFVCHAPSDYFHSHNSPFVIRNSSVEPGFIWTRLKTENPPKFGALVDWDESDNKRKLLSSKPGSKDFVNSRNDSMKRQMAKVDKKLK